MSKVEKTKQQQQQQKKTMEPVGLFPNTTEMLAKQKIREFRLKRWLDVIEISTSSFWWPTSLTWTCLPLPKNPEEVVVFRFECPLLSPDPILGYSATRVCQSSLCGLLLNALFGSICIKYIHTDLRILLELWLETEGKTSVFVWTQTMCMYLMQIDPNSAFSRRPQRSDWHTLAVDYLTMGSGQSRAHAQRLPTTSWGFLGRGRQVQVGVSGGAIYRTITEEQG